MAQIPSLPIDEPVAEPKASPGQFGSVGETIAGLGQETEQMAQANMAFEGHLIYAQRQLKAAQAEIALDKVKSQVHADLNKARTPEEAQAILDHGRGELQNAIAPYEHDRELSKELSIHLQREDVELQNTVNARKAVIIRDSGTAALEILGKKHVQAAINTIAAGGNSSTENKQFDLQLQGFVQGGILYPQEAEALKMQLSKDIQKGSILTKINSPSQGVRDDVIKQLSSGGGNLEHSELSSGELSQLYTHAVDTNHSLTEKEEAGSLNGALNVKAEAFSSPEFKHPDNTPDYEAREKALQDGDWLKSHGIVTPNGKPNYVMAEKLQEDDARQWQMHQKVQRDKDEDVLEKYSPMIYDPKHPLTIAQIEALPQTDKASSKAVNQLKTALFQEQRQARVMRNEERSLGLAERQQRMRELEDKSIATSLRLSDRMAKGDVIDYNSDILTPISKGQMTEADGAKLWHMYKDSDQYPEIQEGIGIISSVYKAMPLTTENNRKAADARDSLLKTIKEKNLHGSAILKEAQDMADQTGKAASSNYVKDLLYGLVHGPAVPTPAATSAPVTKSQSAPSRPKSVPDNAEWNPKTKTWQLQQ